MILYFTGTGNTRMVAQTLGRMLNDCVVPMDCTADEPVIDTDISTLRASDTTHRTVIWCFPIYSWGVPPVVRKFIRRVRLRQTRPVHHFMVATCGDDVGLAHLMWRRAIRRRDWHAVSTWSVQMPNNYVMLPGFDVDAEEVAAAKLDAMEARVKEVARGIRHRARVDDVVRGSFAWVKTRLIYPLFVSLLMSPRLFKVTDACIGCGSCQRVCPMNNVSMTAAKRPEWGKKCAMCLACYHVCPVKAIAYGSRSKGKGQYFNR